MLIKKFIDIATKHKEKIAVKLENETITYGQLNDISYRIASAIHQLVTDQRSIQQVGILFQHGSGMIAALLSVLKAGAAYVPMDTSYPETRLLYMLEHSQATILLTDNQNMTLAETLKRQAGAAICILNIDTIGQEFAIEKNSPRTNTDTHGQTSDNAYILYTSGSTGLPKGVVQTLENVWYYTRNWIEKFQITHEDRMTLMTAFSHDGAVQDIFSALLSGATLYPYDIKNAVNRTALADFLRDEKISIWHSVPTLYRYFADTVSGQEYTFPHLRFVLLGGEALRKHDFEIASVIFPHSKFANVYGQTESSVSCIHIFSSSDSFNNRAGVPTLGEPLDGTDIILVDEEGDEVEELGVGEIVVACNHIAKGYWRDDELSQAVFDEDEDLGRLYWTGDLGRLLVNGQIEMMGRKDFQVKIRGFRVEVGEIETALLSDPQVEEAVVTISQDVEPFLCAYITGSVPLSVSRLREHLMAKVPDYMAPSHFVQLEKIPLTASGKVDRNALPSPRKEDIGPPYEAPRNNTEKELVKIWAEVLNLEEMEIGIDADFFQLGGHSLRAVTASLKIHKAFDVRIALPTFFALSTIRQLAEFVDQGEKDHYSVIISVEERAFYPLTSAQLRLFILQRMDLNSTAYNLPIILRLEGNLNQIKLKEVFIQLIQRQESFRTSFIMDNQIPRQRIHKVVPFDIDIQILAEEDSQEIQASVNRFISPFDLSQAPLLRVRLMELAESNFIFMVDMHHIITDGTSRAVLMQEFMALYQDQPLPPLKLRYRDYACWQQAEGKGSALNKQQSYWLKQFSQEVPVLNLPLDFPRPAVQSFAGGQYFFQLEASHTSALTSFALQQGMTLYMVLMALYNIFLSKISNQQDFVVGTPIAGRSHEALQHMVGMFVNTLAIRSAPTPEKPLASFLEEVKETTLNAFQNQDFPFEDLVEAVIVEKDPSRNPIFDTMFVLQNFDVRGSEIPAVTIPGLTLSPMRSESVVSKFDLVLYASETSEGLMCCLEYCSQLFTPATIERFAGFFKQVVQQSLASSDIKLEKIEIISDDEKRQVLEQFNNTHVDFLQDKTVPQLFQDQVHKNPDSIAVIIPGSDAITYNQLKERSDALANDFIKKGVRLENSGVIIAVVMERSIDMLIAMLAILNTGAAYLPIDPALPQERIEYMLTDSNAAIIIDDSGCRTHMLPSGIGEESLAYVIYTSGSTGRPKGVLVGQRGVSNLVAFYQVAFGARLGERMSQTASPSFDAMALEVWPCLLSGATLYIADSSTILDPGKMQDWLIDNGITISFQSTAMAEQLLALDWNLQYVALRVMLTGGDRLTLYPPTDLPFKVYNLYGPTEDSIVTTYTEVLPIPDGSMHKLPPIGKPIANHQVYILDKQLKPQPIGIPGELTISGVGLAQGYLNNPELTNEKFCRGPGGGFSKEPPGRRRQQAAAHYNLYRTGDLACWLADGNIEFLGRIDSQVKIRGYRIELGEIERQLLNHVQVREAVVVARQREGKNSYLCAYVVPKYSGEIDISLFTGQLREYLARVLASYMVPAFFICLKQLPLTSSGKVDRRSLPEPEASVEAGKYVAPINDVELKLETLFAMLLNIKTEVIGREADFFHTGGNSLLMVKLASEISKTFHINIPVMKLFKRSRLKDIASAILYYHLQPGSQNAELEPFMLLNHYQERKLFCFPANIGFGIVYSELAASFSDWAFYSFDFIEANDRIGKYVQYILSTQTEGPFVLFGYSAGADLAGAVASRLEQLGHEVSHLILLDPRLIRKVDQIDRDQNMKEVGVYLKRIENTIETLGIDFMKTQVLQKVEAYSEWLYDSTLLAGSITGAKIHIITAEDNMTVNQEAAAWEAVASKPPIIHNGFGKHIEMLSPGYIEYNVDLIKEILL
jgi:tyrocidine synthetase III